MTIDEAAFRRTMGCFATGVTVVTALDADARPLGLTVNSFSSVSLAPPLVLFSLARDTKCFEALSVAAGFAVNMLSLDQQDLCDLFAGPAENKFAGLDWMPGRTGAPLLAGCIARAECTTRHRYDGGDHVILVGEVQALDVLSDAAPLIYYRSAYATVAAPAPSRARVPAAS